MHYHMINMMFVCLKRNKELEECIEAQKRQIKELEEKVCQETNNCIH